MPSRNSGSEISYERLPPADTDLPSQIRWGAREERERLLRRLGLFTYRCVRRCPEEIRQFKEQVIEFDAKYFENLEIDKEMRWAEKSEIVVLTERTAFTILRRLLQLGPRNIYDLWKKSRIAVDYSTVLRSLKGMERKGLVQTVQASKTGRRRRVYQVTLLGELVEALARGGWKLAAERIAKESSRFEDCQNAHRYDDPFHYWCLTHSVVEDMIHSAKHGKTRHNVDEIVIKSEYLWIKKNLVEELNNHQFRFKRLDYLGRLSKVAWIKPMIMRDMDERIGEEREWLKTLSDFVRRLRKLKR